MTTLTLQDGGEHFEVTVLEASEPTRVVLFAVGRGGDPQRHLPLLRSLAATGITVVAPHFKMVAPEPSEDDLMLRGRRLTLALESTPNPSLPVAGVGHSINATLLLALAGGRLWTRLESQPAIEPCRRLDRLVLLAPALGFFRVPGALNEVRILILAWAGTEDIFAPPADVEFLKRALECRLSIDLQIVKGAGHFSFMNSPPPQFSEPLSNREAFLNDLAMQVGSFLKT